MYELNCFCRMCDFPQAKSKSLWYSNCFPWIVFPFLCNKIHFLVYIWFAINEVLYEEQNYSMCTYVKFPCIVSCFCIFCYIEWNYVLVSHVTRGWKRYWQSWNWNKNLKACNFFSKARLIQFHVVSYGGTDECYHHCRHTNKKEL